MPGVDRRNGEQKSAGLAQLVEQLICNHQAASSNLAAGTILFNNLTVFLVRVSADFSPRGNKWGNKRRETKPVALHPFRATLRRTLTLSTALDIIAETFKVSRSGEASYLQRTFGENVCANLS